MRLNCPFFFSSIQQVLYTTVEESWEVYCGGIRSTYTESKRNGTQKFNLKSKNKTRKW